MKTFRIACIVMASLIVSAPAFAAGAGDKQNRAAPEKKTAGVSSIQTQAAVRQALDGLVDAYVSKSAARFMSYVAEGFAGDNVLLDRKIRRDFSRFIDMDLRYTLNNVTADAKNENISVSVTFTRSYTDVKTTQRINKTGLAEFVFRMENGSPKLYAMKRASMFGIGG